MDLRETGVKGGRHNGGQKLSKTEKPGRLMTVVLEWEWFHRLTDLNAWSLVGETVLGRIRTCRLVGGNVSLGFSKAHPRPDQSPPSPPPPPRPAPLCLQLADRSGCRYLVCLLQSPLPPRQSWTSSLKLEAIQVKCFLLHTALILVSLHGKRQVAKIKVKFCQTQYPLKENVRHLIPWSRKWLPLSSAFSSWFSSQSLTFHQASDHSLCDLIYKLQR